MKICTKKNCSLLIISLVIAIVALISFWGYHNSLLSPLASNSKNNEGIFDIYYHTMGGSTIPNGTYNTIDDFIDFPVSNKNGYVFDGWYNSEDYSVKITVIPKGQNKNIDLYAKWIIKEYSINYFCNGGEIVGEYVQKYTIKSSTFYLPIPTKLNNIFVGWYNKEDLSGELFEFIELGTFDITELFAKWTVKQPSIVYYLDGGKNNPLNVHTFIPGSQTIVLQKPEKKGYEFGGWYSNNIFEGNEIKELDTNLLEYKLYAKWISDIEQEPKIEKKGCMSTTYYNANWWVTGSLTTIILFAITLKRKKSGGKQ